MPSWGAQGTRVKRKLKRKIYWVSFPAGCTQSIFWKSSTCGVVQIFIFRSECEASFGGGYELRGRTGCESEWIRTQGTRTFRERPRFIERFAETPQKLSSPIQPKDKTAQIADIKQAPTRTHPVVQCSSGMFSKQLLNYHILFYIIIATIIRCSVTEANWYKTQAIAARLRKRPRKG